MRTLIPPRRQPSTGFTLIELMIALAVLLFGVASLAGLQSASIKGTANAYRTGVAISLAQDSMERLMRLPYILPQVNPNGPCTIHSDIDPTTMGIWPPDDPAGPQNLGFPTDGVGAFVNALGTTDPAGGPVMFERSHHTVFTDANGRALQMWVRVTWSDPQDGKRHGVTITGARRCGRYDAI